MDNLIRHIRQSLSWKLSLGILLMAIPIFVLSIGFLFIHSRDKVKKKATEHAASVVNTTMQHITRYMDIVETATDVNGPYRRLFHQHRAEHLPEIRQKFLRLYRP